MPSLLSFRMLIVGVIFFFTFASQILAQSSAQSSAASSNGGSTSARPASSGQTTPPVTGGSTTRVIPSRGSSTQPPTVSTSTPPDVYLNVPDLSVGRIELDVEELSADINLNADVAKLVQINAGVQVRVQKINITIADVEAELELIVRLGHLVDIVGRVFESVDLNPLLVGLVNNVTSLIGDVIGAVDGLLGSITKDGKTLNFLIDNLGNIVQEVVGGATGAISQIVGNFNQNMTQVGDILNLGGGLIQKTFQYAPLNALVDIIFNTAGQVVQATVQKKTGGGSSTTPAASSTATPVTLPVSTTAT